MSRSALIAGTGSYVPDRVLDNQYFNELLAKMMKVSNQPEEVQKITFDLDELPAPEFRDATLGESWNMSSFDLLILFLLVACFFMIGYVGFVRSDIR